MIVNERGNRSDEANFMIGENFPAASPLGMIG